MIGYMLVLQHKRLHSPGGRFTSASSPRPASRGRWVVGLQLGPVYAPCPPAAHAAQRTVRPGVIGAVNGPTAAATVGAGDRVGIYLYCAQTTTGSARQGGPPFL